MDLPAVQLSDISHTVSAFSFQRYLFYDILKLFKSMYYCLVNSVIYYI